jgi:hypothetical protein
MNFSNGRVKLGSRDEQFAVELFKLTKRFPMDLSMVPVAL